MFHIFFNISSTFKKFVGVVYFLCFLFDCFEKILIILVFLCLLWNTLFKKPFVKLLFLCRRLCNTLCIPRFLNSFSFYFNLGILTYFNLFDFRKVLVIGYKKHIKQTFVCSVWIV